MSIVALKKAIYGILSDEITTYDEKVVSNSSFPYVEYTLEAVTVEAREDFIVTIDIWDNDSDSTTLDEYFESITSLFNYTSYIDSDVAFRCYIEWRGNITDEDETIYRRQIRVLTKVFHYDR